MKRVRTCDNLIRRVLLSAIFALALLAAPQIARAQNVCGLPGNDNIATLSGVINTYYPGVTANAGALSIQVGAARIDGAAVPITSGDLLLVIQMQDATINTANSANYGAGNGTGRGANIQTSGVYEYVVATTTIGLGANTVSIRGTGGGGGLRNTYTNAASTNARGQRKFQVVRVPQYASATLTSGLTAAPWDHVTATGGILAFDVAGQLTLGGATVSVNGRGFRGGGGRPVVGGTVGGIAINNNGVFDHVYPTSSPTNSTVGAHGAKGEGIAGTPRYVYDRATDSVIQNTSGEGYPGGSNARGAPGNAGGGGTDSATINEENSGGGGGGNGGIGGAGGNTWRANSVIGGIGGAAVANDAQRVVLGGGGGAGSRNNSVDTDSSGAAGGGIVLIRTGSVSGTGIITANGDDAQNDTANDGGGGGGAGGSVIVMANGGNSLAGLTIRALGGRGGDAWRNSNPAGTTQADRHGPGGGGAGGFIGYTTPAPSAFATGGARGLTTTLGEPYGATAGGDGITTTVTQGSILSIRSGAQCVPLLTVTKVTTTAAVTNTVTGTTATYTILVSNAADRAPATSVVLSDLLPTGFTFRANGTVTMTNGATRPSVTNPAVGATNPAWSSFTIPATGQVALTFTVDIAASVTTGTYQNPATATYFDPARTVANGTTSASYNSASSTNEDVTVTSRPDLTITKSHTGNFTRGETGIYTIIVRNSGAGITTGAVTVTDTLPAGLTPTAPIGNYNGWTCSINLQVVSCTRSDGLLTATNYPAIDITVNVLQTAAGSVTNTASVSGGGETNVSNNSANDPTTIVSRADLSLTKTADNSAPVINQNVVFTLTVSNAGPSNATGITVRDQLPAGLSFVSAVPAAAYNSVSGVWTVGTVNASQTSTLQITARVTTSGTTITNTAQVTASGAPDPDSTPNNNNASEDDQASAQLGVPLPPEVKLQKRCTAPVNCEGAPQLPGTELTYTITFTNTAGTSAAQGLTIIDIIPITDTGTSIIRNTEFKVGSMTFSPGTSTLSIIPTDYKHYNDPLSVYPLLAPWTPSAAYTPSGAFDFNVTYVGWKLTGTMPPGTSGSVSFTVRIR